MSILIKGMAMPQNCDACPMLYEYRFCSLTDDHAKSIGWKTEEKRMPNCPLEEAQEPKHGKWVERGENDDGTHNIQCSACEAGYKSKGHANSIYTKQRFHFCPNCGADMRERSEE